MRHLTLSPHLTLDEQKARTTQQKQIRLHTYWQILHAVANGPGKRAQEIADMLGTAATIVKRIVCTYNTKFSMPFTAPSMDFQSLYLTYGFPIYSI